MRILNSVSILSLRLVGCPATSKPAATTRDTTETVTTRGATETTTTDGATTEGTTETGSTNEGGTTTSLQCHLDGVCLDGTALVADPVDMGILCNADPFTFCGGGTHNSIHGLCDMNAMCAQLLGVAQGDADCARGGAYQGIDATRGNLRVTNQQQGVRT